MTEATITIGTRIATDWDDVIGTVTAVYPNGSFRVEWPDMPPTTEQMHREGIDWTRADSNNTED